MKFLLQLVRTIYLILLWLEVKVNEYGADSSKYIKLTLH